MKKYSIGIDKGASVTVVLRGVDMEGGKEDESSETLSTIFNQKGEPSTPSNALRKVCKQQKKFAMEEAGGLAEVLKAVVAVAPNTSDEEIQRVAREVSKAGITVLNAVASPIAAAAAAGLDHADAETKALVIDLGATGLRVALVKALNGELELIAHDIDESVSGQRLTQAIYDQALQGTNLGSKLPTFKRQNLWEDCESAKMALSFGQDPSISMRGIKNEDAANPFKIDSGEYEEIIENMTENIGNLIESFLSANELDTDTIDAVISVGGGLNISEFKRKIEDLFQNNRKHVLPSIDGIAKGAAKLSGILAEEPAYQAAQESESEGDVIATTYSTTGDDGVIGGVDEAEVIGGVDEAEVIAAPSEH